MANGQTTWPANSIVKQTSSPVQYRTVFTCTEPGSHRSGLQRKLDGKHLRKRVDNKCKAKEEAYVAASPIVARHLSFPVKRFTVYDAKGEMWSLVICQIASQLVGIQPLITENACNFPPKPKGVSNDRQFGRLTHTEK